MNKNLIKIGSFLIMSVWFKARSQTTNWEFEKDLEGWKLYGLTGTVSNGFAELSDPGTATQINYYYPEGIRLNPLDYKFVHIRFKNGTSDTRGRFLWFKDDGKYGYIIFDIIPNDAKYSDYIIELDNNKAWNGSVKSIRFDLPDSNDLTGAISIDKIKLNNDKDINM